MVETLTEPNPKTPPQAFGKELKPLKSWLLAQNVSEENVGDVTVMMQDAHIYLMKLYSKEYDSLPTIGVSGRRYDLMDILRLTLHVSLPSQALTAIHQRTRIIDQVTQRLTHWYSSYIQSLSDQGLLVKFHLVEEIPVDDPDFLGMLCETDEEKAQYEHAFYLVRRLYGEYMPIFEASEELNKAYKQLMRGLVNKSIDEQKAIVAQLQNLAGKIKRLIGIAVEKETAKTGNNES